MKRLWGVVAVVVILGLGLAGEAGAIDFVWANASLAQWTMTGTCTYNSSIESVTCGGGGSFSINTSLSNINQISLTGSYGTFVVTVGTGTCTLTFSSLDTKTCALTGTSGTVTIAATGGTITIIHVYNANPAVTPVFYAGTCFEKTITNWKDSYSGAIACNASRVLVSFKADSGYSHGYQVQSNAGGWCMSPSPLVATVNHTCYLNLNDNILFVRQGDPNFTNAPNDTLRIYPIVYPTPTNTPTPTSTPTPTATPSPVPCSANYMQFIGVSGASVSGSQLSYTGAGGCFNEGARSSAKIVSGHNGYVQARIRSIDGYRMFGLSNSDPNVSYASIQFAAYPYHGGGFQVYESGSLIGDYTPSGFLQVGDLLRVKKTGSTITYWRLPVGATFWNLLYTSSSVPTGDLFLDTSLCGGSLDDLVIVDESICGAITTPTATPTNTPIPTNTPTATYTPTPTNTATNTPTYTPIPTFTSYPTYTPFPTPTHTPIPTDTPVPTIQPITNTTSSNNFSRYWSTKQNQAVCKSTTTMGLTTNYALSDCGIPNNASVLVYVVAHVLTEAGTIYLAEGGQQCQAIVASGVSNQCMLQVKDGVLDSLEVLTTASYQLIATWDTPLITTTVVQSGTVYTIANTVPAEVALVADNSVTAGDGLISLILLIAGAGYTLAILMRLFGRGDNSL